MHRALKPRKSTTSESNYKKLYWAAASERKTACMFQRISRPQKSFITLYRAHLYVMQSEILSDITNNVFMRYFKNFIYSSVDQVVELL